MKIIVDTLGADRGADVIIRGALKALQEQSAYDLILAADPSAVEGFSYDDSRVEILPAFSFVTNDDDPREMVKGKQDTSMVLSLEKLRDDAEVAAMITAGSTGCAITRCMWGSPKPACPVKVRSSPPSGSARCCWMGSATRSACP